MRQIQKRLGNEEGKLDWCSGIIQRRFWRFAKKNHHRFELFQWSLVDKRFIYLVEDKNMQNVPQSVDGDSMVPVLAFVAVPW